MANQFFKTKKQLFTHLKTLIPELDYNKCFTKSRHSLVLESGECFFFHKLSLLLKKCNELMGKEHFDTTHSVIKGKSAYLIYYKTEGVEYVKPSKEKEEKEELPEEGFDQEELGILSLDVEDSEHEKEVDWKWIEGLKDTTEDRLALDQYAEGFDIKLRRNMKLVNMIKKFKEALEA